MTESFRLTEDGRIYRKGKRVYANKDVYEVRHIFLFGHKYNRHSILPG